MLLDFSNPASALKTLALALPLAALAVTVAAGATVHRPTASDATPTQAASSASPASTESAAPIAQTAPRAPNPEEAGVRVALDAYLQGHATGQPDAFRRAFHPDTRMLSVRDGQFTKMEIADYIARAPGKPADNEATRKRSIDAIDISGDAAIARLTLDYPDVKFTDYMTLLKINGEWRIVSKVVSADRRPAAERKPS